MIDSTNPRSMADNIRHLAGASDSQASAISTLQTTVEALRAYSTTEVNTGNKWIDDSTIYRKVLFVESLPNATTVSINHGITNLKNVIKLEGVSQATEGASGLPFPYATTLLLRYTSTQIAVQASGDSSNQSAFIIMEYTKSVPAALNSPAPDDTRSIEPEIREEIPEEEPIEAEPIEEPVVEVKKTTRKKTTTTE